MRYTFQEYVQKLLSATGETLYMVFVSTVIAAIFGTAIGIVVAVTAKKRHTSQQTSQRRF